MADIRDVRFWTHEIWKLLYNGITTTIAGVATEAGQAALLAELQLKADLTETQPSTLQDAAGNAIDSHLGGDGGYHLGVAATVSGAENITRNAWVSTVNALGTFENIRLVGANFDGTAIDANFWTETPVNGGAAAQSGIMTLETNGAANGAVILQSVRRGRFVVGSENRFVSAMRFTTAGVANNVRRVGMFDTNNGYYFELDGTTFSIGTRLSTVDTLVSSGSFNGNLGATYVMDTNWHKLEIEINPLAAYFYVDGRLLHTVGGQSSGALTLLISMENTNSGGISDDIAFSSGGMVILRQGPLVTNAQYYHLSGNAATHVLKIGAGVLQKIMFNNTSGTSLTIYDNTAAAGTVIGIITTTTSAIGEWAYDVPFSTGLTLVTVGNSLDATIVYE